MAEMNCWEFKKCGRQPGGEKVEVLGICPAARPNRMDGMNGGTYGGRVCWMIAGTLCGGRVQGTFASKIDNCTNCDFYQHLQRQENMISI